MDGFMSDWEICPVEIKDAESLWRNCFWQNSLHSVRDYLAWCLRQAAKGRMVRLVAEADGEAIANAQLTFWPDRAEIGSLVVAERYQRHGIATALVAALEREARQRGVKRLEIGVKPLAAGLLALYQRWGFHPVRKIELPHTSGENHVVYLIKELTPPD